MPFFFAIFLFALSANAAPPCRLGPLGGEDTTEHFIRLARHLAIERRVIDAEELNLIAGEATPSNPIATKPERFSETEAAVFRTAFAKLIATGEVDWTRARAALRDLARQSNHSASESDVARAETAGVFHPVVRVAEMLPKPYARAIEDVHSWEASDGAIFLDFRERKTSMADRAVSLLTPTGRLVEVAGGVVSRFFEVDSKNTLVTVVHHEPATRPHKVTVLDARTGTIVREVDLSKTPDERDFEINVASLIYRKPDGKLGLVNLWGTEERGGNLVDMTTGKITPLPKGLPNDQDLRYATSPDGRRVFAYGFAHGEPSRALLYDVLTGKKIFEKPMSVTLNGVETWSFHCNARGEIFLTGGNHDSFEIFDVARDERITVQTKGEFIPTTPAFLEDGAGVTHFSFVGDDQSVSLLDVRGGKGQPVPMKVAGQPNIVTNRQFLRKLSDGRLIVVAPAQYFSATDSRVAYFDFRAGSALSIPILGSQGRNIAAVSSGTDGTLVGFSADKTGTGAHQISATQLFGPK